MITEIDNLLVILHHFSSYFHIIDCDDERKVYLSMARDDKRQTGRPKPVFVKKVGRNHL